MPTLGDDIFPLKTCRQVLWTAPPAQTVLTGDMGSHGSNSASPSPLHLECSGNKVGWGESIFSPKGGSEALQQYMPSEGVMRSQNVSKGRDNEKADPFTSVGRRPPLPHIRRLFPRKPTRSAPLSRTLPTLDNIYVLRAKKLKSSQERFK